MAVRRVVPAFIELASGNFIPIEDAKPPQLRAYAKRLRKEHQPFIDQARDLDAIASESEPKSTTELAQDRHLAHLNETGPRTVRVVPRNDDK